MPTPLPILVPLLLAQPFFQPLGPDLGDEPNELLVVDVNLDARPDIVTINDASVSLLIASDTGYHPALIYPLAGQYPNHAAIADLNDDGYPDVVLEHNDAVVWLLNQGDATLAPPQTLPSVHSANDLAVGDLNDDGRDDVLVSDTGVRGLYLFLAQPDGALAPAQIVGDFDTAGGLAIADFTGDGLPDVVVTDPTNDTVTLLTNLGGATFSQGPPAEPGNEPYSPIPVDLDLDADLDLVLCSGADQALVMHNVGADAFQPAAALGPFGYLQDLAVADVSADGYPDIVLIEDQTDTVVAIVNDGAGTFLEPAAYALEETPSLLRLADLDGNSNADVIVTHYFRDKISTLLSTPGGTLSDPAVFGTIRDPYAIGIADLDLDGDNDLALASRDLEILFTHNNNGDAAFESSFFDFPVTARARLAADLNADGLDDVIITHKFTPEGNVTIYLSGVDGLTEHATLFAGAGPTGIVAEDLDADGDLDLAFACYGTEEAAVLRNDGAANFDTPLQYPVSGVPEYIAAGDIDDDGDVDLALATVQNEPHRLHVLLNSGDATFTGPTTTVLENNTRQFAMARIDDDPYADVVIGRYPNQIDVFRGQPDGTVALASTANIEGDFLTALDLADADADGRIDLAAATYDDAIHLLYGVGDATFTPGLVIAHPAAPTDVEFADLDGAGDLDLVTGAFELYGSSHVIVYQSTRPGTYANVQQFVSSSSGFTLGHIDARPGPDMLVGSSTPLGFHFLPGIPPACPADFNADGNLNVLDFVAFQQAWQAADPAADCDADGAFTVLDFVCFQNLFQKGCP